MVATVGAGGRTSADGRIVTEGADGRTSADGRIVTEGGALTTGAGCDAGTGAGALTTGSGAVAVVADGLETLGTEGAGTLTAGAGAVCGSVTVVTCGTTAGVVLTVPMIPPVDAGTGVGRTTVDETGTVLTVGDVLTDPV